MHRLTIVAGPGQIVTVLEDSKHMVMSSGAAKPQDGIWQDGHGKNDADMKPNDGGKMADRARSLAQVWWHEWPKNKRHTSPTWRKANKMRHGHGCEGAVPDPWWHKERR